jgi:hypothetical protein
MYAQHWKAYVLGTSFKHYLCWKFWTTATRATRTSGAAFFKHKYITNPTITPKDRVIAAAGALAHALHNWMPPHMQAPTIQVLQDLQNIFQQAAINYNADQTTHIIPDDDPRVPGHESIPIPRHTSKGGATTHVPAINADANHPNQCPITKGDTPGHTNTS